MARPGWETLSPKQLDAGIETAIARGKTPGDLAFYGTGLLDQTPDALESVLKRIDAWREEGSIQNLRLSLRPDQSQNPYIPHLIKLGLELVELWVPTLDPGGLSYLGPSHSPPRVREAIAALKGLGLQVALHLAPGMPGTHPQSDITTGEEALSFKPHHIRLTPVILLKGSNLAEAARRGLFIPMTPGEAVQVGKALLDRFEEAEIPVVRYGWQPPDLRVDPEIITGGAFHPALRTLVESSRMFDLATQLLQLRVTPGQAPELRVNPKEATYLRGLQNANLLRLRHRFRCRDLAVIEEADIPEGTLNLRVAGRSLSLARNQRFRSPVPMG